MRCENCGQTERWGALYRPRLIATIDGDTVSHVSVYDNIGTPEEIACAACGAQVKGDIKQHPAYKLAESDPWPTWD